MQRCFLKTHGVQSGIEKGKRLSAVYRLDSVLQKRDVEVLAPVCQNVTLSGNRVFTEVTKLEGDH